MIGEMIAFLYMSSIVISTVWLHDLGKNLGLVTLLIYPTLITTIVFNLFTLRNCIKNHKTILKTPIKWLKMSTSLIFIWLFTYISAIYGSPDFFIPIFFLTSALCTSIYKNYILKSITCIFAILIVFIFSPHSQIIILLTSLIAGASAYLYYSWSYLYGKEHNMSTLDLLSIRFYLLLIVLIIYSSSFDNIYNLRLENYNQLLILIILAISNMILPIFLSQKSLDILGVEKFTFILSFLPVLTFIVQYFFTGLWDWFVLLSCIISSLVLNYDVFKKLFSSCKVDKATCTIR